MEELEGVDLDHHGKVRHFFGREALPDYIIDKQDAGLGVVYKVVDVAGLELMKDGNGHGAVGYGCQETHAPVGLVAGADGHFVSFLQAALLKSYVKLGNSAGDVTVGQGHALVVGDARAVPVADYAFLKDFVYRFEFHIWTGVGFSST